MGEKNDRLVDINTAAKLCGIKPATLRAYDSRREPKKCPFPRADPAHEIRQGNRIVRQWPANVVLAWNSKRLSSKKVDLARDQYWVDRAARIANQAPPDDWRRVVKIETITNMGDVDLVGIVSWWQQRSSNVEKGKEKWVDRSDCRHSSIRSDMWHRRMTFLG